MYNRSKQKLNINYLLLCDILQVFSLFFAQNYIYFLNLTNNNGMLRFFYLMIARLFLRTKNQRLLRDCVYYKLNKCKYICGMPYDNGQRRTIETESPM